MGVGYSLLVLATLVAYAVGGVALLLLKSWAYYVMYAAIGLGLLSISPSPLLFFSRLLLPNQLLYVNLVVTVLVLALLVYAHRLKENP